MLMRCPVCKKGGLNEFGICQRCNVGIPSGSYPLEREVVRPDFHWEEEDDFDRAVQPIQSTIECGESTNAGEIG